MNKYINTDLRDSIKLMRIAIMNALNDIETGEETIINLGPYISQPLFIECLQEADWKIENEDYDSYYYEVKTPTDKKVIINLDAGDVVIYSSKYINVSISVCLSSNQDIEVPLDFNEEDEEGLKEIIKDQIFLPTDALKQTGYSKEWTVDNFAII